MKQRLHTHTHMRQMQYLLILSPTTRSFAASPTDMLFGMENGMLQQLLFDGTKLSKRMHK